MQTSEITYMDIKADVLRQVRGMEPGTYEGGGILVKIERLPALVKVKVDLRFTGFKFYYTAEEYELKEAIA